MRATYIYNPKCGCDWCANGGDVPEGTASNGHSFGYDVPHIPPAGSAWTYRRSGNA